MSFVDPTEVMPTLTFWILLLLRSNQVRHREPSEGPGPCRFCHLAPLVCEVTLLTLDSGPQEAWRPWHLGQSKMADSGVQSSLRGCTITRA